MVFSSKINNNNEGWGMGFLLILFHHHPDDDNDTRHSPPFSTRKKPASISQQPYSTTAAKSSSLIFSKAQSTLSICGILVFTTILLFTLSTFELEPVNNNGVNRPRRVLREGFIKQRLKGSEGNFTHIVKNSHALQGMGDLYMKGSKAMTDLIVGHVAEDMSEKEFRSFLRLLYYSGVLSKSDVVFIFDSPSAAARFGGLVMSECDSFLRLVQLGRVAELGGGFGRYGVRREVGEGEKEPMWGRRRGNDSSEGELTRSSYGSVVGFEVSELDPEDTLSGFLDHVPINLRRWAGYPMLLGRVRRQFKHMMLVDVKSTLILSDPFSRVRNRSSESLFLWSNLDYPEPSPPTRHHGKRNSAKARESNSKTQFNPGVIVGGSRGVRRFATAALTEIARSVIEHKGKGKNSVTESGLVNQLVHSGHLLKNINLITPTESLAEMSSLSGLNSIESSGSSFLKMSDYVSVVQRGHSGGGSGDYNIDEMVIKEICASHKLYFSVYSDCLVSQ